MPLLNLSSTLRFSLFLWVLAAAWLGVGASYGLLLAYHFALFGYLAVYFASTPIAAIRTSITAVWRTPAVAFWWVSLVWFLAHIAIADYPRASVMHAGKLVIGCSATLLVMANVRTVPQLTQMMRLLIGLLVAEVIVALGEMMAWWRYPISAFSHLNSYTNHPDIYNHVFADNSSAIADIIAKVSTSPTGLHWNSNDMSVTLLLLLPFLLVGRNTWWRNVLLVALIAIFVWAGARLCMLATVLIWVGSWWFYVRGQWQTRGTMAVTILVIMLLGSRIFAYQPDGRVVEAYQFLTLQSEKSASDSTDNEAMMQQFLAGHGLGDKNYSARAKNTSSTRMALIRSALQLIQTQHGIGIGGDNFKARMEARGGVGSARVVNMHCFWLELITEGGVLYGLGVALAYLALLRALYRRQRNTQNATIKIAAQACLLTLVGFAVSALSLASCIYFLPMYILLGISVAVWKMPE